MERGQKDGWSDGAEGKILWKEFGLEFAKGLSRQIFEGYDAKYKCCPCKGAKPGGESDDVDKSKDGRGEVGAGARCYQGDGREGEEAYDGVVCYAGLQHVSFDVVVSVCRVYWRCSCRCFDGCVGILVTRSRSCGRGFRDHREFWLQRR